MDCQKKWPLISVFVKNLFCFCVLENLKLSYNLIYKGFEIVIYWLLLNEGEVCLKITFEARTFHLFLNLRLL
jgi:hypothetical protein